MTITKNMTVADIFENHPRTRRVFREFGFEALANPVLRKTFGRLTTVDRGCRMHGVPLEPFLDALNQSLLGPTPSEDRPTRTADPPDALDPRRRTLLKTRIDLILAGHPATRAVFIKHFGDGCFSCPAFGQEDAAFACLMHNTDPAAFAEECLAAIDVEHAAPSAVPAPTA